MEKSQTTIYFIRHGELDNPKNILYEREIDLDLSDTGRKHVGQLAKFLKNKNIFPYRIFSSPLKRARQSAEIISSVFDQIKITEEPRLLERFSKHIAGRPIQLEKTWGDTYKHEIPDYIIETPEGQAKRILEFVMELLFKYSGKTIFIISHGDPLAFAIFRLLYPKKTLPSFNELMKKNLYLEKAHAMCMGFRPDGKVVEHEILSY